jgi:hypothetical protein
MATGEVNAGLNSLDVVPLESICFDCEDFKIAVEGFKVQFAKDERAIELRRALLCNVCERERDDKGIACVLRENRDEVIEEVS